MVNVADLPKDLLQDVKKLTAGLAQPSNPVVEQSMITMTAQIEITPSVVSVVSVEFLLCLLVDPIEFSCNTQSWQCWHFLYCPNLKNMTDRQIHHINYNSKHHGKCKFHFKCIRFLTVSNLFTLEVVQKCQHCQLCVLQENSDVCRYI